MSNRRRITTTAVGIVLMGALAACNVTTDPDYIGLYYNQGSSDGNEFDHCTKPGGNESEWNNEIVMLPTSSMRWTIDDVDSANSHDLVVVSTKPTKDQPSGVQVKVSSQTSFVLNTYCDSTGGTIKKFWESVGRTKHADTAEGMNNIVKERFVPILAKVTRDVIRNYEADALVGNINNVQAEASKLIADQFASELNRAMGGPFFCGPSYQKGTNECPPVEMFLISVEYKDEGIQAARNEKQKALEEAAAKLARAQGEAAALVAEAKGKADAAAELAKLYASKGWVDLQKQIIAAQALVDACKAAGNGCTLVVGSDGQILTVK